MRAIAWLLGALGRRLRRPPSSAADAGRLAFTAVSTDPGLLARLPRGQARRIGEQAEAYALALLQDGSGGRAATAARDAAGPVLRAIRQSAAQAETDLVSKPETAMEELCLLGEAGLYRLDREAAEVLMSAAGREVARRLRSGLSARDAAGSAEALRIVEAVCAAWRILPLAPFVVGDERACAAQLVELWRDAAVCAGRADAGAAGRLWEDARDGHAFGAVWLLPSILSVLARAEAETLARDARAASIFVLRSRSSGRGVRAAIEAARSVLVSCGEGGAQERWADDENPTLIPPRRDAAARAAATPARVSHA